MLADTPRTWPNGPSISTLHVLLLFGGIPLLVILGVSLMVLAPGWVRGPRYRPGQPWQARSIWFGPPLSGDSVDVSTSGIDAEAGATSEATLSAEQMTRSPQSGGASAGW